MNRDGDGFLLNTSDWSEEVMYEYIIIFSLLILTGCATHSVTLGPMTVYGSNEQSIPEPRRE